MRNSAGLNWTEVQRGQIRRIHSTRGSQFGHVIVATFIRIFLSTSGLHPSEDRSITGVGVRVQP